ncbi:transferase [Xylariomycetidae sp. FL0641]|nr:transferase [Xylariomycetidae sp. FL0641]
MPKEEVFHVHPLGWENDPEEERFKVSVLDYLAPCTYNNYALFFRLEDAEKPKAVEVLKNGLERTLSQVRQYCGTIEKDPRGGHSFTKKKDSTVRFFVQYLDAPEDADKYPSFDDIHKAQFGAPVLGDLGLWSVYPMTYGEKPACNPNRSPVVSAFKANLIRGGMVFIIHHHHYTNDVMGWAGFVHQLAENCNNFFHGKSELSTANWSPACLDRSSVDKPEPPEDKKVDGPPPPQRHPDHIEAHSLLFHLPKSKAKELKKLASPTDGTWISTYDAFCAYIWRSLTRVRAPVFNPDLSAPLFWCEAIDMRRRFHNPKVPARNQGNIMFAALSPTSGIPQPTAGQILSEWPLSKLAGYVRAMTNSVTQEALSQTLEMVATVRDKSSLNIRIDGQPPLSILMTDHRDANIVSADFGFKKPFCYRHLMDVVTEGVIIVYPSRDPSPESEEGPEFSIAFESRLKQLLIDDPEFNSYFEYRGVDALNTGKASQEEAKA